MPMKAHGGWLLAFAVGAAGCSTTEPEKLPAEISSDALSYRPEGCSYDVTSPPVEKAIVYGRKLAVAPPDSIHVGLGGEAATTFAVTWRSEPDATASELLFGTSADAVAAAESAGKGVTLQRGHSLYFRSLIDSESTRVHEVHVCGLQPATKYFYKVGNKGAWSKVYSITTAPVTGSPSPLTVAVTGDARNDPSTWAAIQRAVQGHGANLQLFSGDAVLAGANQPDWNQFFNTEADGVPAYDMLASAPFMPVNGNHEDLAINYLAQFALPQGASSRQESAGKEWYSFDYGNIHVISLNDTSADADLIAKEETEWLKADLAKVDRAKTPWIFVNHHRPLYSCAKTHGADEELRALWQPIYDQYKVDLVINGHVHNYERSKPIRGLDNGNPVMAESVGKGVPVNESGTLYLVSGGAGAPLYEFKEENCTTHTQAYEKSRHYVLLEIAGKTLKYKALRLDGSVIDEFEYTKN